MVTRPDILSGRGSYSPKTCSKPYEWMVRALVLGKVDNLRFPAGDLDHHNTLFIIYRIAYCLSKKEKKGFLSFIYLQK